MDNHDILFQWNGVDGPLCSGFFVCRCNDSTLQLFSAMAKRMSKDVSRCDQHSLNHIYKNNLIDVQCGILPHKQFWLPGRSYTYTKSLVIPYMDILFHHANWTIGVENKIQQLIYVRDVVTKKRKHLSTCPPAQKVWITSIYKLHTATHRGFLQVLSIKWLKSTGNFLINLQNRCRSKYHKYLIK